MLRVLSFRTYPPIWIAGACSLKITKVSPRKRVSISQGPTVDRRRQHEPGIWSHLRPAFSFSCSHFGFHSGGKSSTKCIICATRTSISERN